MYTNLTFLLSSNKGSSKAMSNEIADDYGKMFRFNGDNPTRILLEGQPGFGKTLFTHKIASDWASEGCLSMFDFIVETHRTK